MEVKPGYKQTEVGVIPEEWNVVRFEYAAEIIDPQPDHRTPQESTSGDPYIGISDFIDDSTINWGDCRKIVTRAVEKQRARFLIRSGDIIFGKIGTIGMPKFVPDPHVRYGLSANVLLLQPRVEPYFLMSWLRSDTFQRAVNAELQSTSQAAFGINKMRRMLIAEPPESEQSAIAEALSDVDGLLGGLDRLIAKKRDLKQAAMQQLLTGQTRLPGFHGEWEVSPLCEYARFCPGTYLAQDDYRDGQFEVQGAGSPMGRHTNANFTEPISVIGRVGTVGRPRFMPVGCWVNNNAGAIVAIPGKATPRFVHLLILTMDWSKATSVTAQPFLVMESLMKMEFRFPLLAEQTAIAEVLADMDAELAALEQRRAKTRALKQAMMQELLTGRIRLV